MDPREGLERSDFNRRKLLGTLKIEVLVSNIILGYKTSQKSMWFPNIKETTTDKNEPGRWGKTTLLMRTK